jgi:hypothetical protein
MSFSTANNMAITLKVDTYHTVIPSLGLDPNYA